MWPWAMTKILSTRCFLELRDFGAPKIQASEALTTSHLVSFEHRTGEILHGTSLELEGSTASEL
jgi:hypothetical protein